MKETAESFEPSLAIILAVRFESWNIFKFIEAWNPACIIWKKQKKKKKKWGDQIQFA